MWAWITSWWVRPFPLLESKEKVEERKKMQEEVKALPAGRYRWSPTKVIELYGSPPTLDPMETDYQRS